MRSRDVSVEIEPLVSVADGTLFFGINDSLLGLSPYKADILFTLSSGVSAQLNVGFGPGYLFISPMGFRINWDTVLRIG